MKKPSSQEPQRSYYQRSYGAFQPDPEILQNLVSNLKTAPQTTLMFTYVGQGWCENSFEHEKHVDVPML